MLKDLIVNLTLGAEKDPTAGYALSVAETFGAHVTGMAFALKPVIPGIPIEGLSPNVIHNAIKENEHAAQSAIDRFEVLAKKHGVPSDAVRVTETLLGGVGRFATTARCYDLAVLAQANPDNDGEQDLYIESALFTSGRPILIVPYIQKAPAKFDRIVCCWDGGEPAARAIADAMPFLKKAKKIDLLMVTTAKTSGLRIAGTDMAQHLARHGLNVNVQQIVQQIAGANIDVGSMILSFAADNDTDLLVMGGYGHSRWRELVLGGATRGILSSMTVPTLMSH